MDHIPSQSALLSIISEDVKWIVTIHLLIFLLSPSSLTSLRTLESGMGASGSRFINGMGAMCYVETLLLTSENIVGKDGERSGPERRTIIWTLYVKYFLQYQFSIDISTSSKLWLSRIGIRNTLFNALEIWQSHFLVVYQSRPTSIANHLAK